MPALWKLCEDGELDEVRAELARGGDVNNKDYDGRTALMCALWEGHNAIVKMLLQQPAVKTNEKNNHGGTALHYAAAGNNAEGARMLLLHPGFNSANSTDINGETALMMALRFRKKEFLLELLKHESVSLDLSEGAFGVRYDADLLQIIREAKERRAEATGRSRRRSSSMTDSPRALRQMVEEYRERMSCKVCLDSNAEVKVMIRPCGHLCLCETCSEMVGGSTCPMCRTPIEEKFKVFM